MKTVSMKRIHCFPSCISMQMMVVVFFCQMIPQSHLFPLNQEELDFMLDPVAQAQQDSLETKRVVAKSVFNVPMKTTVPPIIRCPPDSQRIVEGGPCVPTASSITINFNLYEQLAKESVQFNNNRRRPGGPKTKHRGRSTTTIRPQFNHFGTGTSPATGSRQPAPPPTLVHSQDSAERQPVQVFPSTAYVLHSPQENIPLPINQQMTSVNAHQPQHHANNNNHGEITTDLSTTTTTEISTSPDEVSDQTGFTMSSTEIPGSTLLGIMSDTTDSLATSSTFTSTDEVAVKTKEDDMMEASSTSHVPRQFQLSSTHNNGLAAKDVSTTTQAPAVRSVNFVTTTTSRPDRPDFHFSPTTTNTDQLIQTLSPFGNSELEDANNTTEKVWFSGDVKSTIEPPVAAEEFNNFSPGPQSNSGNIHSKLEFTTNRDSSVLSWAASTSAPTSFATVESLMQTTEEPFISPVFDDNNFATTTVIATPVATEVSSSTETNQNPPELSGKHIMTPKKNVYTGAHTQAQPKISGGRLQPEIEVDFDMDALSEDISSERTPFQPANENSKPQTGHLISNPNSFFTIKPTPIHTKPAFTNSQSQIQNESTNPISLRPQSIRSRNPILTGNTDFPPQIRPRQRQHNQNQFYVYDYLTFHPDRPRLSR